MRYSDHILITEAQRRAEQFESEVERAHLLTQAPKGKSWRYGLAQWLLRSAARLEPQLEPRSTQSPC